MPRRRTVVDEALARYGEPSARPAPPPPDEPPPGLRPTPMLNEPPTVHPFSFWAALILCGGFLAWGIPILVGSFWEPRPLPTVEAPPAPALAPAGVADAPPATPTPEPVICPVPALQGPEATPRARLRGCPEVALFVLPDGTEAWLSRDAALTPNEIMYALPEVGP